MRGEQHTGQGGKPYLKSNDDECNAGEQAATNGMQQHIAQMEPNLVQPKQPIIQPETIRETRLISNHRANPTKMAVINGRLPTIMVWESLGESRCPKLVK